MSDPTTPRTVILPTAVTAVLERVLWTFIFGAISSTPVTLSVGNWSDAKRLAYIALSGGIAALLSLVKNLTFGGGGMVERMLTTFVQAAVGNLPATLSIASWTDLRKIILLAVSGGVAAISSVVKNGALVVANKPSPVIAVEPSTPGPPTT